MPTIGNAPFAPGSISLRLYPHLDLRAAGIVDPAKVVRAALQDAGSIAALLITTEAMIADIPQKDAPATGGAG